MRGWTLALIATLAAIPLALPASADCVPTCDVPSTSYANVPPVIVITSGETATWTAVDGFPHTTTDPMIRSFADDYHNCAHVTYGPGSPGSARFRIEDGALLALDARGVEKECRSAEPMPEGGFRFAYICLYHALMKGDVIVLPE